MPTTCDVCESREGGNMSEISIYKLATKISSFTNYENVRQEISISKKVTFQ